MSNELQELFYQGAFVWFAACSGFTICVLIGSQRAALGIGACLKSISPGAPRLSNNGLVVVKMVVHVSLRLSGIVRSSRGRWTVGLRVSTGFVELD